MLDRMRTVHELMDLSGCVALVTGGGGHIGQAACATLAELGADICVLDLDERETTLTASRLVDTHGVRAEAIICDLGDVEAVRSVAGSIDSSFGRLDILVNCAALVGTSALEGWAVPFEEQSAETWRLAQDINLLAPFVLTQACVRLLGESGKGSVINVASIYGVVGPDYSLYGDSGMGNPAAYAASKGGLIQLTRWLATTLAPDIRVNSITPGGILRGQAESFIGRYQEKTPLRRLGTEEDLKGAVAFLASQMSSYVTGHNLVVDGGWTAW